MGLGNIGDDNSANAQALATPSSIQLVKPKTSDPQADLSWCEWCATNPFLATFNSECWHLNEAICSPIVVAYLKNAAPAAPPPQSVIDSQSPDDTINQILQQSQANAVAAATQAAADQGSYLTPVCTVGSPTYNPLMCWVMDNQKSLEIAAGVAAAIWLVMKFKK